MKFPLAPAGAFDRGDGLLPVSEARNVYAEQNQEDPSQLDLIDRPRAQNLATNGTGRTRGMSQRKGVFNDDALQVVGTELYRVTAAGVATLVGTIPGAELVSIAIGPTTARIANTLGIYVYDGATLSAEAFPDTAGVVSVAYVAGYFLAVRADSNRLYITDLLTDTWDAVRFVAAVSGPDLLRKVLVAGDAVFLVGDSSTETWVLSGQDDFTNLLPPLSRAVGRNYQVGAANASTCVELDNTMYWVSSDRRVSVAGATPIPISHRGVEDRLSRCDVASLSAWPFPWGGHKLYVLNMLDQGTWVYDLSTKRWFEWSAYGLDHWPLVSGVQIGSDILAGDESTNQLYKLTDSPVLEDDVIRRFTVYVPAEGRQACTSISLDCNVGLTTPPALARLEVSDDRRVYKDRGYRSLGKTGRYDTRVRWTRQGLLKAPGRLMRFTVTGNVRTRFSAARLNEAF